MSEDTIKRSDAIKVVWGDDVNPSEDGMVFEAQSHIDRDIRLIPSADRKKTMGDELIRRSDAIGACAYETIECYEARKTIRALPSADRPQGEWIDKDKNLWECSNCEMVIYSESEQDRNEFHKWCSRCGARMKGADDGTR